MNLRDFLRTTKNTSKPNSLTITGLYATHQLQRGKKNSVITSLKQSGALISSLCKGQPAPCKAVSVQCHTVYKSSRIIHRIGEKERERHTHTGTYRQRERVCMSVCYQLSRRVAGCPRFWTKISGFSGSGFSLAIVQGPGCHLPTRRFSSSATTGMGENSPTTYTLQGSSLKTWVNMYVFYYLIFLFFTNVCNLLQAQGEKSSGQSHEISFS